MTELSNGTIYLGPDDVPKYLKGEWEKLVPAVERALKSYSAGKIVQPVRAAVSVEKRDGVLFAMPAYNAEEDTMATKIVTVFPRNKEMSIAAIHATILLNDASNGKLKAILDGNIITKMRTAAASLVATKYLAGKKEVLAILGAGAQARSHIQAFSHFYNFKEILIWNVNKQSAIDLMEEMKEQGIDCNVTDTVEPAVRKADIIVTVTMSTKPVLKKEWVKDGAHINAVGAPVPEWQELESDLMLSSIVYVDSKEGALAESGDIIQSKAPIYAEIGEVILGLKEAFPQKTTIFKSLGMAAEDVAAAEIVYENYLSHKKKALM